MKKFLVLLLKKSRALSSVAIRVRGVHPKHLVQIRDFWIKKYVKKNDVILDLGCANGERDFKIAGFCQKIVGVDYDEKSIEMAKKKSEVMGFKNIDFIQDNIFNFVGEGLMTLPGTTLRVVGQVVRPVPTIKFDKIILLDVLEHIIDRKKLLASIHSILKDNGQFFVSIPNKNTSWKKLQKSVGLNYFTDPDHKIEYSALEIKKELEDAGFKILKMEADVIDTPWAPFFDLIGAFSLSLYRKCLLWKRREVIKHPEDASGWEIVCEK